MFSLKIIDTDGFLDMPKDARLLYYDLAMRADDDGFVSSPKKIMRMINASDDDIKILISKQFVIPFETGICVIKHWKIHNYIQKDRYTETLYKNEKQLLKEDNQGIYEKGNDECIQTGYKPDTQVRLGKDRDRVRDSVGEKPTQKTFIELLEETVPDFKGKLPDNILKTETQKFILYWTEKNPNGKKEKWQMQQTFDVKRRLATWLKNTEKWDKPKNKILKSTKL